MPRYSITQLRLFAISTAIMEVAREFKYFLEITKPLRLSHLSVLRGVAMVYYVIFTLVSAGCS